MTNDEVQARVADMQIKVHNLAHAFDCLVDELADIGIIPVVDEPHKGPPQDPELGDSR